MNYRDFGKTGEKISTLGFGCMRLPEYEKDGKWFIDENKALPMLYSAYEKGINYFDTGCFYCHSNSEAAVGKALKSVRDKVLYSTKLPLGDEYVMKTSDFRSRLETSLKTMDTDHIDFYHFWGLNKDVFDNKVLKLNLLEEAVKAKEEGLIKHISFSFHDDAEVIKYIIDTAGVMETMLCQYNLLDRKNEEMIAYAAEKGLGVVAMGPVGGGRLAAPTEFYEKVTGKKSMATYELALRFVLGNKDIACALSGMQNIDMLEKNIAIANIEEPMDKKEWAQITEAVEETKKFSELYCTGCAYCQPCPKNINIPAIFNMYTYHNVYGLTDLAKEEFAKYKADEKRNCFSECVNCGFCEKKCPQHLKVREQLEKVEKILSAL